MTVADFADLMGSHIVVHNPSTAPRSVFGQNAISTAAGSTFACRWEQGVSRSRYTEGLLDTATGMLWIASTSTGAISMASQIRLPDGSHPPVLRVIYERDETGSVHHTVCVVG